FTNLEECLDFIKNYKKYLLTKNEIFSDIEKKLSTNRNHLLFNEIKEFKKKKFEWPKKDVMSLYQKLCKSEEEIIEELKSESDLDESENE
ncbi:10317_t:CDS:1, partial [Scutellospora calospora]